MRLERECELSAWQEIRADWVNDNRSDAKEKLCQMSKIKMLRTISEALEDYAGVLNQSGDLVDLREILLSIVRSN